MGLLSKAARIPKKDLHSNYGLLSRIINKKFGMTNQPNTQENEILSKLSAEFTKSDAFQCIVFESSDYPAEDFFEHIDSMISGFGFTQKLNFKRCLIVFDLVKDKALISQHLEKTAPGNVLIAFRANNPQEALTFLKPYL